MTDPRPSRTMSGTAFALGFAAAAVAVVAFIVLVAPALQDDAARRLRGVDEREPLAVGAFGATEWTVLATQRQDRVCVIAEFDGSAASEACADPGADLLGVMEVADSGEGWLFTLVGGAELQQIRLELSDGSVRVPRVFRPQGYPATFAYTTVEPGLSIERASALDRHERLLQFRACDGPLATADGLGSGCRTS